MGGVLQVDPGNYVAASSTMGTLVAPTARSAADGLTASLSGCGGMAGSDPAGASWADGCDAATASILAATQDAINGAFQLAGLLEQTGFNYSAAESASTSDGGAPPLPDTTSYAELCVVVDSVPKASGYNEPSLPTAWSEVQAHVGRVWPNGHQDRLRRAAAAWNDGARFLYDASHAVADAVGSIALQVSPECDDAITVCNGLRDNLEGLAGSYNIVSAACEEYAGHIDDAHREVEAEIKNLLEWMAGIEVAGAVTAFLTFGASEVVSQAAVLARTISAATRIAAIIDRLGVLARDTIAAVSALTTRIAEIARELSPLATARRVSAITNTVEAIRAGRTAAIVLDRLATEASVDLTKVPANARAAVLDALERARTGRIRFTGHDGKLYRNHEGALPIGTQYQEWTAAAAGQPRGGFRVIIGGEMPNPTAIYFWDHVGSPIRIGP